MGKDVGKTTVTFQFSESQIGAAEKQLGVTLPSAYRRWMAGGCGIEVEVEGCSWFLYPIEGTVGHQDSVDDLVAHTQRAKQWLDWPKHAIDIGWDGGGGHLVLLPGADGRLELGRWGGHYGKSFSPAAGGVDAAFPVS